MSTGPVMLGRLAAGLIVQTFRVPAQPGSLSGMANGIVSGPELAFASVIARRRLPEPGSAASPVFVTLKVLPKALAVDAANRAQKVATSFLNPTRRIKQAGFMTFSDLHATANPRLRAIIRPLWAKVPACCADWLRTPGTRRHDPGLRFVRYRDVPAFYPLATAVHG